MSRNDLTEVDQALARELGRYYDDALGFVMFAFPWDTDSSIQLVELVEPWKSRYPYCKYGPDEWACRFLDDISEEVKKRGFDGKTPVDAIQEAVVSGHGIGKSSMTAWLILWIASTRPYSKGTVTANTSEQLKTKTWAELGKWKNRCITGHWFEYNNTRGNMNLYHKMHKDEWRCDAQTCREENSEAFAGQHAANSTSYYINDEASAIPDIIWEVQEGGLTDGEPMRFAFGNPTRNTGRFRECSRRFRHRWRTRHIDSRTVAITNKEKLNQLVSDYGEDSDVAKIRVRGIFPSQSAMQFISEADVDAAFGRHLRKDQYDFAPVILTCDPAWTGDDELIISKRQGLASWILKVIPKNDNDVEVAQLLARLEDEHDADAVFVDGGFGTGIVSAGQTMGRTWQIVWFSGKSPDPGCLNLRAFMWKEMRDWLKAGGAIPADDGLRNDLTSPETVPRLDGKIQLESKQDMKDRGLPSPNKADALALSFAYPVAKKHPASRFRNRLRDQASNGDYDPLKAHFNRGSQHPVDDYDPFR